MQQKTHRQGAPGGGLMSAGFKKDFLGQQPPRASAHACTTTTSATTRRARISAIRHSSLHSRLNGSRRQQTCVTTWIHNFDGKNHIFSTAFLPAGGGHCAAIESAT